jgi:tRNA (guanine-N7-)-methyltransferase
LFDPKDRHFFGRRLGRPLNKKRVDVLDALLPVLSIPSEILTQKQDLDPASLFKKKYNQHWFEIGFGSGEHLAALMDRHPDHGFIGAEPYINGMSNFLNAILTLQPPSQPSLPKGGEDKGGGEQNFNIRVFMDDALLIGKSLKAASLDGIYILNPDPWHKKRHHKRRIVNAETLDIYARILKPGGQLIMSSDVPDMAEWMLTHTINHPAFTWTAQSRNDWSIPPKDWITTAYEVKGAKGAKQMAYLFFIRK